MIVGSLPEPKKGLRNPPGGPPGIRTARDFLPLSSSIHQIDFNWPAALYCNSWGAGHNDRMTACLYEPPSLASGSPSTAKNRPYHLRGNHPMITLLSTQYCSADIVAVGPATPARAALQSAPWESSQQHLTVI